MTRRKLPRITLTLDKIVGGGQALATCADGRKVFVWGGLPGETVEVQVTKKKSNLLEGYVTEVITASTERVAPLDPDSYLSTSPWQIMTFDAEQHYKAALIEEAFELHNIVLPHPIELYTNGVTSHYRNKVEFSWYGSETRSVKSHSASAQVRDGSETDSCRGEDRLSVRGASSADTQESAKGDFDGEGTSSETQDTLALAFFRRGSKGKVIVEDCSLLPKPMMQLARAIRDLLQSKGVSARQLKTLLIRCDQAGNCVWQLYIKDEIADIISAPEAAALPAQGGEVIYSDPRSPASRITTRVASFGDVVLCDTVLSVPFRYATEGFFQVNIPVYEHALHDMRQWVSAQEAQDTGTDRATDSTTSDLHGNSEGVSNDGGESTRQVIDLYSGVGSIGLTIGGEDVTLIEINEDAVREMRRNITTLGRADTTTAVLAPSEKALEYITSDMIVIVDPPRAGLHADVITRLLETLPPRIIYLSCNPVTQARDIARLGEAYGIRAHRGYNFFPRTPHIEHLVILDRKPRH